MLAVALLPGRDHVPAPAAGGDRIDSIAVLPFESAGEGDDAGYLGEGIAESVSNKLSRIGGLRVVPCSVALAYKGRDADPGEVGKELGVAAVVMGRVIQRGDALIVSAELIDVQSVAQIWGEQYNRTAADIFAVQEELTREIARNLQLQLSPGEDREISRRGTDNPEAYQAYLRGQAMVTIYSQDTMELARAQFQRALEIDPQYARALAGLATVEAMLYRNVEAKPKMLVRAADYARRALAIDPKLARAHAALGEIHAVRYDYAAAVPELEQAVELEPEEPAYHDTLGWVLGYVTPPDGVRAEKETREAIRLSPRFAAAYYHLGRALLAQGRLAEATDAFEYAYGIGGADNFGALGLGQAELAKGKFLEALAAFATDLSETPLELVYRAAALAGLGRRADALVALEKAVAGGYADVPYLESSPYYGTLRDEPRFAALLQRARELRAAVL